MEEEDKIVHKKEEMEKEMRYLWQGSNSNYHYSFENGKIKAWAKGHGKSYKLRPFSKHPARKWEPQFYNHGELISNNLKEKEIEFSPRISRKSSCPTGSHLDFSLMNRFK